MNQIIFCIGQFLHASVYIKFQLFKCGADIFTNFVNFSRQTIIKTRAVSKWLKRAGDFFFLRIPTTSA